MKEQNQEFAKIRWQCRRGMLELDQLLLSFFEENFNHFTETEKRGFVQLLNCQDQNLYAWLVKRETPSLADFRNAYLDANLDPSLDLALDFNLIHSLIIKIRDGSGHGKNRFSFEIL